MPDPTTRTHASARSLLMLLVATLALVMTLGATVSSAQAAPAKSTAAASECYLYEPDCYHGYSGKTWGTTQSCYTFSIRY